MLEMESLTVYMQQMDFLISDILQNILIPDSPVAKALYFSEPGFVG